MQHHKVNGKGFGHIVILIAVVLLGVLVFVGTRVMNKDGAKDSNGTSNSQPATTDEKSYKQPTATTDTSKIATEFPKKIVPDLDYTVNESNTITYNNKTSTTLEIKIKGTMKEVDDATKAAIVATDWRIDNSMFQEDFSSVTIANNQNEKEAGAITWEPSASEPGYIVWTASISLSGIQIRDCVNSVHIRLADKSKIHIWKV